MCAAADSLRKRCIETNRIETNLIQTNTRAHRRFSRFRDRLVALMRLERIRFGGKMCLSRLSATHPASLRNSPPPSARSSFSFFFFFLFLSSLYRVFSIPWTRLHPRTFIKDAKRLYFDEKISKEISFSFNFSSLVFFFPARGTLLRE